MAGTSTKADKTGDVEIPDNADEMFGDKDEAAVPEDDFIDLDDLLNEVIEDDAESWVPKVKDEAIAGRVIKVGTAKSDFAKEGEDPRVPAVVIQTKNGDKFRIVAFASVLKREIIEQDPQPGDIMAVKYFGTKPLKTGQFKGRDFKNYGVIVRKPPVVPAR